MATASVDETQSALPATLVVRHLRTKAAVTPELFRVRGASVNTYKEGVALDPVSRTVDGRNLAPLHLFMFLLVCLTYVDSLLPFPLNPLFQCWE